MTSKDLIININRLPDHLIHYIYNFIKKKEKYSYKKIKLGFTIMLIIIFSIIFCYLIGYILTNKLNIFFNIFIGWIVFSIIYSTSIFMYSLLNPEILNRGFCRRSTINNY